jgi:hypothetical protein
MKEKEIAITSVNHFKEKPEASGELIVVPVVQLQSLLAQNVAYEADLRQLYGGVLKIFSLLGMADNDVIKPKVFSKEGMTIREIGMGIKPTVGLFLKSGFSKKAEEILKDKLSFMKPLFPLLEKYANEFKDK